MLNKDGSVPADLARFRGPDLDSATPAELVAVTARLNNALRRLGSGWAVFVEAQRVPRRPIRCRSFRTLVSELVDVERREQFREEGAHFESFYYLQRLWMPPAEEAARAEAWLYEGASKTGVDPEGAAEKLRRPHATACSTLSKGSCPRSHGSATPGRLTYLHSASRPRPSASASRDADASRRAARRRSR